MPPSTKPDNQRRSCGHHTAGRCAAGAITRLLSACVDQVRDIVAAIVRRDDGERRPYVATLSTLAALGWRVTEIRPDGTAPTLWSVTIERFDGGVEIIVINAADPGAALEELARYAAADAEDPQ